MTTSDLKPTAALPLPGLAPSEPSGPRGASARPTTARPLDEREDRLAPAAGERDLASGPWLMPALDWGSPGAALFDQERFTLRLRPGADPHELAWQLALAPQPDPRLLDLIGPLSINELALALHQQLQLAPTGAGELSLAPRELERYRDQVIAARQREQSAAGALHLDPQLPLEQLVAELMADELVADLLAELPAEEARQFLTVFVQIQLRTKPARGGRIAISLTSLRNAAQRYATYDQTHRHLFATPTSFAPAARPDTAAQQRTQDAAAATTPLTALMLVRPGETLEQALSRHAASDPLLAAAISAHGGVANYAEAVRAMHLRAPAGGDELEGFRAGRADQEEVVALPMRLSRRQRGLLARLVEALRTGDGTLILGDGTTLDALLASQGRQPLGQPGAGPAESGEGTAAEAALLREALLLLRRQDAERGHGEYGQLAAGAQTRAQRLALLREALLEEWDQQRRVRLYHVCRALERRALRNLAPGRVDAPYTAPGVR